MYLTDTFCHLPTATGIAIFIFITYLGTEHILVILWPPLWHLPPQHRGSGDLAQTGRILFD